MVLSYQIFSAFSLLLCGHIVLADEKKPETSCPVGSFVDSVQGCILCPPGMYNSKTNRRQCVYCPFGTFRAKPGAISIEQCIPCPENSFSAGGAEICSPCAKGTISPRGARRCGACGPGFELLNPDDFNRYFPGPCGKCERGFYSNGPLNRHCQRCPDGTFASGIGNDKCMKCPPGTFRRSTPGNGIREGPHPDSRKCSMCQSGTFMPNAGASICNLCPFGTVSGEGATVCTPCPKGTFSKFRAGRGDHICQPCPTGTTSKGIRPANCKEAKAGCPFGTFEGKSGDCEACLPGERLDKTTKTCIPCPSDMVSKGGDDPKCRRCPQGKVPLGDETILERSDCECAPGTVDDMRGGCMACPPGYIWQRDFSVRFQSQGLKRESRMVPGHCAACPVSSFTSRSGATKCEVCPDGTFQDEDASAQCKKCPKGSRSVGEPFDDGLNKSLTVRTSCEVEETACRAGEIRTNPRRCEVKSCPAGTALIKDRCGLCKRGQVYDQKMLRCRKCPRDSVSDGGLQTTCVKCPPGKKRDFDGSRCECDRDKAGFGELDGRCQVCPAGWFLMSNNYRLESRCAPCMPGYFTNKPGTERDCPYLCDSKSITVGVGAKKCTLCPPGKKRPENLFGQLLNRCV